MSRFDRTAEFTDQVFTRDRRTWWASMDVPGVNVCTDERLTVDTAFDRYLNWTVTKAPLYARRTTITDDGVTVTHDATDVFGHFRDDNGVMLGSSSARFTLVQNHEVRDLMVDAIGDTDHAVASIGALRFGAVTFASVDFPDMPDVNAEGQKIHPFLAVVNTHDAAGSLRVYATGIRPECLNTIDIGWLAGVRLGRLLHTTNVRDRVPALRDEIRRYLDLAPRAEETVRRLIRAKASNPLYRSAIDTLTPIPEPVVKDGKVKNAAAITRASARRDAIVDLAFNDPRVTYPGTAWGLFQAFSTYNQHERGYRRTPQSGVTERAQSTLADLFMGRQVAADTKVMGAVLTVLDVPDVKVDRGLLALV